MCGGVSALRGGAHTTHVYDTDIGARAKAFMLPVWRIERASTNVFSIRTYLWACTYGVV